MIIKNKQILKMLKKIYLPLLGLLSFTTWYFDILETHNILIYSTILIVMASLGVSNTRLLFFTLFTVPANRTPYFLEFLDNKYFDLFGKNITALNEYHTFLYMFVFIILIFIMIIRAIKNKHKFKGKLALIVTSMTIYSFVTLIWTPSMPSGLSEIWFMVQGYLVYLLIRNDNDKRNYSYEFSWFLSMLLLVISLQYFKSYYDYFVSIEQPTSFFKYWQIEGKKAIKLWANPNIVAAVFGISLVPSFYKYVDKKRSKLVYLFIPFELLIIYAIFLTKSQGMYYSLLVGLLFIPLLFIRNKKTLYFLIASAVVLFASGMAFIVRVEEIFPKLYDMFNEFTTNRIDIYKEAIVLLRNPNTLIFGMGVGSDRTVLTADFFHSWFFQVLVTRGIVGMSLVALMIYFVVEILFDNKDRIRYFIAVAIIIYLAHGITDSGFDYQHIGVIFYFMVAFLEKRIQPQGSEFHLVRNIKKHKSKL